MDYKDYYAILGIERHADAKLIKSAYRKKAKQFHPDLHPEHAEKFKELGEAYEVLGDPEKRQRYDTLGTQWKQAGGPSGAGAYQQWAGAGAAGVGFEDLFGGQSRTGAGASGFSDFFEAFFGGGSRPRPQSAYGRSNASSAAPRPQESLDIEQGLSISLKEAILGGERSFYSSSLKRDVTIQIPKGVTTGKKIRVQGAGKGSAYTAGRQGDLYLKVTLDLPKGFVLDGLDIYHDLEVPVSIMVLGGKVPVTLPSGESIQMTIPPYSQTGHKLRIRQAGFPNMKQPSQDIGHLYLRLMPRLPKEGEPHATAFYNAMKSLQ
ncbi:MAG: J domain-containing protein [Vampirovibrio sp.]